ncbi:MAG: hypothetical protein ACREM2_02860 [Vulcanimicrobiaceae bacterium]
MVLLNAHDGLGFLVFLLALAAIVWAPARRYVLYALALQILLGAALWGVGKVGPPPVHWILALLTGGIYAMANAFERRGRPRALVLGTLVLGAVVIALVFSIGMNAVQGQTPLALR